MNKEQEMVRIACKAIDDKKAIDIKIIDIHEVSVIADYEPKQVEGTRGSNWILMDYGDVIIHVFDEENRLFYDLERIWRDGKELDAADFLK